MAQITIPAAWQSNNTQQTRPGTQAYNLTGIPAELRLAENNLTFAFSPKLLNPTATKAKLIFNITGNVMVGSIINLISNAATITLTASYTPTFNEFYTQLALVGFTYRSRVAESIGQELIDNLAFFNNYNIKVTDTTVTVEAKEFGSLYSFTTTTLPSGITLVSNTAGQYKYVAQQYIDYQIFIDVYKLNGDYGEILNKLDATYIDTLYIPFADDENTFVNINNLIKDFVDVVLPQRQMSVGFNITQLDKQAGVDTPILTSYFIVWGDSYKYTENGDRKKYTQGCSPIQWCQNGAFDKLNPYILNDKLFSDSVLAFKWLTNCPQYKEVTYNSHEYLQVIRKTGANDNLFGLDVTLKFYDGTTFNYELNSTITYNSFRNNLSFDVSPFALNINAQEAAQGKLVDEYTVRMWWYNGTVPTTGQKYYSQPKIYKFFRLCNTTTTDIIFFNKWGAWDSLEFFGEYNKTVTREQTTIERSIPINTNNLNVISSEVNLNNTINNSVKYKLNSNFMTKDKYDWIRELLDSTSVFIWDVELQKYRHIVITEYDYEWRNEQQEFNLAITYSYTVPTNNVTR